MVIDAELFAPESKAIEPGDPNNRVPCATDKATVSKPPAGNAASVRGMGSFLVEEKLNAVLWVAASLSEKLTVGAGVVSTVSAVLVDADDPLPEFVLLTVSESEPRKFELGV